MNKPMDPAKYVLGGLLVLVLLIGAWFILKGLVEEAWDPGIVGLLIIMLIVQVRILMILNRRS